jgi:hypothetical protein
MTQSDKAGCILRLSVVLCRVHEFCSCSVVFLLLVSRVVPPHGVLLVFLRS